MEWKKMGRGEELRRRRRRHVLLYINEAPFKERGSGGVRILCSRFREGWASLDVLHLGNPRRSNAEMALEPSVRPLVRQRPSPYF